jgi:hypothetical protein
MAPPIDILDRIKGYEMVSFDTTSVPPPIEIEEQECEDQLDGNEDENNQVNIKSLNVSTEPKNLIKTFCGFIVSLSLPKIFSKVFNRVSITENISIGRLLFDTERKFFFSLV